MPSDPFFAPAPVELMTVEPTECAKHEWTTIDGGHSRLLDGRFQVTFWDRCTLCGGWNERVFTQPHLARGMMQGRWPKSVGDDSIAMDDIWRSIEDKAASS